MHLSIRNVVRNPHGPRFLISKNYSSSPWHEAINKRNPSTNAMVYTSRSARTENPNLPLHDMAVAVKDSICTSSMPTSCSSAMLREFTSPFDATVVGALKSAGAYIVGKTNCDEFGMGSLNIHSVHGPVVNPHQPSLDSAPWENRERRSAGGSSGGSAAAVAADMCDAALSTDTGGSTRLPASYCGLVGLKPSYGLVSRWGVVSFADSLDCVGVMAKNIHTVKRVFNTVSFHDARDPTAATLETRHRAALACKEHMPSKKYHNGRFSGLRIGVPQEYFPAELDPRVLTAVRRLLERLKSLGASLISVSLPSTSHALSAYYVISSAEASSNMARYDGVQYGLHVAPPPHVDQTKSSDVYAWTRSLGFGPEVQKRILLGTYALTADAFDNYFLQAQRIRKRVREDFNRVFRAPNILSSAPTPNPDGVDVLLHPSAIRTAPPLRSSAGVEASAPPGLEAYVQDVLTVPASLAGLPALNVPLGQGEDGWPVGASIVGQWGCDEMVLEVGEFVDEQPT